MLNQKIEKEVEEAHLKREEEKAKGNEDFEGEQEYSIRKRNLDSLQKEMDIAMGKRESMDLNILLNSKTPACKGT